MQEAEFQGLSFAPPPLKLSGALEPIFTRSELSRGQVDSVRMHAFLLSDRLPARDELLGSITAILGDVVCRNRKTIEAIGALPPR